MRTGMKYNKAVQEKIEKKQKIGNGIAIGLKWFLFATLILYCISMLLPLIWLVLTSLKSTEEYVLNVFGFPEEFQWENTKTSLHILVATYA